MNLNYYINKLNKGLHKLPENKQDNFVADINKVAFSNIPKDKKEIKIKNIFNKYFK